MDTFVRKAGVASTTVETETILVDSEGQHMITVNRLGGAIWNELEQSRSADELVDVIAAGYPTVDRTVIDRDVRAFVDHGCELGIIERTTA